MNAQAVTLLVGVLLAVGVGLTIQAGLGRLLKRRNRLLAKDEAALGREYALGGLPGEHFSRCWWLIHLD